MRRRTFLHNGSRYSLGFLGLQALISSCENSANDKTARSTSINLDPGYGPLISDPKGVLNLPAGFSYKVISTKGDQMSDGLLVPGAADGMASFPAPDGKVLIIRNHEVSPGDLKNGPFGKDLALLDKVDQSKLYDYGRGSLPCLGGTTTILYNPASGEIEQEYLSLAGTIRNCAGGPTPWNSWVSCEENTSNANSKLEKNHGYNFEVPASALPRLVDPIPITGMGRFNHEAICVDPRTHIVYQTEDRGDGLIYRYLPNTRGNLLAGGKLQVLAIKGKPSFDTTNWQEVKSELMEKNKKYQVEWLDIGGVDTSNDDLRYRGFKKGAARFARGEGMWFGQNEAYFACTNGGLLQHGQIFKYTPSNQEGQSTEQDNPPTLEIFVEPNDIKLIKSCDNLTIAGHGDLVICEDRTHPRIVGITPSGGIYHIGENVGYESEFAGAIFSPDGSLLFVNIQSPGLTLVIEGPWSKKPELG